MSKLCLFTCIISSIKQNNDPPGFIVIFRRRIMTPVNILCRKWRSKKKIFRDSVSWRWKSGLYIGHELYSQSALSYTTFPFYGRGYFSTWVISFQVNHADASVFYLQNYQILLQLGLVFSVEKWHRSLFYEGHHSYLKRMNFNNL